ncbi:MAG: ATP-dependent DNA helicase, partial [bacterium]
MCAEVHSTLEHGGGLAVEAGTGVGKSLAYLLPAALWAAHHEQRVVVSTHTRILQSQLVEKDAPLVAALLGGAVRIAAAYGQENYVCRFRLAASVDRSLFDTLDEAHAAERLFQWAEHSEDGLLLAYPGQLPASLAGRIGRDSAACRRDDCPHRRACHYVTARRSWEQSQVLVVNHALLFSAITGEAGLLPEFGALILDEAHRVEEVAARHFGAQASLPGLLQSIDRLAGPRDSLAGSLAPRSPARRAVQTAAAAARTATEALAAAIEPLGENGATRSRLRDSVDTTACAQAVENLAEEVEEATGELDDEMLAAELDAGGRRLRLAADALRVFAAAPSPDSVRWLERPDPGRVTLQSAPLSIAERMREAVYSRVTATVLTSATLTVTESFDFFASRLGLNPAGDKEVADAIGVGGADVVLAQHLEHGGPGHPRHKAGRISSQGQGGEDQVPEGILERDPVPGQQRIENVKAGHLLDGMGKAEGHVHPAGDGKEPELAVKDDLEEEREPKGRQGDADQRQDADRYIHRASMEARREHAEDDPDDGCQRHAGQDKLEGVGQAVGDLLSHRPLGGDRFLQVAAQRVAQIVEILHRERPIEAKLFGDAHDLLRFGARPDIERGRIGRHHPREGKGDHGEPEQHKGGHDQAFEDVIEFLDHRLSAVDLGCPDSSEARVSRQPAVWSPAGASCYGSGCTGRARPNAFGNGKRGGDTTNRRAWQDETLFRPDKRLGL